MTLLENRNKILRIFEYLASSRIRIDVRIQEIESTYASRLIEILPCITREDSRISGEQLYELILEKLAPESGNELIQRFPETMIEFSIQNHHCWFHTTFSCISSHYPYYGLAMDFPLFLEMDEKRDDERIPVDLRGSLLARFNFEDKAQQDASPELNVLNYSNHGLGLLVPRGATDILGQLKPGETIPVILLTPMPVRFEGTVRHVTKIEEGEFEGDYLMGLESTRAPGSVIPK